MSDELRIYIRHLRAAKLCMGGARQWFAGHGLSWDSFVSNGIEASTIRALTDGFGNRVLALAEEEARNVER